MAKLLAIMFWGFSNKINCYLYVIWVDTFYNHHVCIVDSIELKSIKTNLKKVIKCEKTESFILLLGYVEAWT